MIKYQEFQVTSTNASLTGRMYYSDHYPANKNVIICHGFGASMKNNLPFIKPLTSVGFHVYLFNFKQFHKNTDQTSVLTEKANLFSILDYVKKISSFKTLDLVGCSQGGLVAALVANDRPRLISKLALFYPAFNIPDEMRSRRRKGLNGIHFNQKYIRDAQKLDPWNQIRRYRRPVLICHGNQDQLVKIGYAEKAHSTYKNSKFVTIKNGGHGFHRGLKTAMSSLVKFLKM